jgi:hypothetical protein
MVGWNTVGSVTDGVHTYAVYNLGMAQLLIDSSISIQGLKIG